MANEQGSAQHPIVVRLRNVVMLVTNIVLSENLLEWSTKEGESPVHHSVTKCTVLTKRVAFFGIRALKGGKFHPKLNMATRLIANKYREGKVKRTLKRELKVLEIVKGEANIAVVLLFCGLSFWCCGSCRQSG